MNLGMYFGLILVIAGTVSLFLNGAAKMLGYRSSLLYGLTLAFTAGIFCTMSTSGLPLAESRRDKDKDLLLNLAVGLGCFSGLVSVHRGKDQGPGSK